jgi:uncharacterized protein (TIGR03790 family)
MNPTRKHNWISLSLILPVLLIGAAGCSPSPLDSTSFKYKSFGAESATGAVVISNIDPWQGSAGQWVNIAGSGFTGLTSVTFNGAQARFRVDHNGWMSAEVPAGATNGYVALNGSQGSAQSSRIFQTGATSTTPAPTPTTPPATTTSGVVDSSLIINNIAPRSATAGQWVDIAGAGFSRVTKVEFAGITARFRYDHDGWMSAEVPAGAPNGAVVLRSSTGYVQSSFTFTTGLTSSSGTVTPVTSGPVVVQPAPTPTGAVQINNFEPKSATTGTWISFSGSGFVGTTSVRFGGVATTQFRIDHDGWMSAMVPANAKSGFIEIAGSKGSGVTSTNFTVSGSASTPTTTPVPVTGDRGPAATGTGINSSNLAIIVNDNDSQSVAVADYYRQKRAIPDQNIIHVRIPVAKGMWASDFNRMKMDVDARTPSNVQAYVISWTMPFIVECMSITSAMTFGYDSRFCTSCGVPGGARSSYFDSGSTQPFTDYRMRPSMMLAGTSFANVKALIDRGAASDYSRPQGTAYMFQTNDELRSSRIGDFQYVASNWNSSTGIRATLLNNNTSPTYNRIVGKTDVFLYHTGLTHVDDLNTNTYLPGAVGDHMTSYGGVLNEDEGQMGALRWLEAGATGSYGTVVEPCAWTQKFPKTSVLLRHYVTGGETLLESYWKSVEFPGEGVFVGDPLARPFAQR